MLKDRLYRSGAASATQAPPPFPFEPEDVQPAPLGAHSMPPVVGAGVFGMHSMPPVHKNV